MSAPAWYAARGRERTQLPAQTGGGVPAWYAKRGPRVGATVDLEAARKSLERAWSRLHESIASVRVEPDPLGSAWRSAWEAQHRMWLAARESTLDGPAISAWARRLAPWVQEFQRRVRVEVGAMTRRQLETEMDRLSEAWRRLKRDVESYPRDDTNPISDEWRSDFAADYQRWRDWIARTLEAPSWERAIWAEETEAELRRQRAELVRLRREYQEITGREPSGTLPAEVDAPPLRAPGSEFLGGMFAGASGLAVLAGLAALALIAARA